MKALFTNITGLKVDAIVNAANSSLLGGGGVDGAIHRAAGHELVHECRLLGGCKPGDAKITGAYKLPAKHIIHTVGPVWNGGTNNEEATLASCYLNALLLCQKHDIRSIAFPCISTGIYAFPKDLAATIAQRVCSEFLVENNQSLEITFCCFEREDFDIYQKLLANHETQ